MHRTLEAIVEADGSVRLLEEVHLDSPRRALITILDETVDEVPNAGALLSEEALAEDWNRPEEDEAWEHLQPGR